MNQIIRYSEEQNTLWDEFVTNQSINGTFLQTRNFLNYHEKGKFRDCSIIIYKDSSKIIAVIPACEIIEGNNKIFYSHLGSTYGGPVISEKYYSLNDTLTLLQDVDGYVQREGFTKIIYKLTPDIFSTQKTDLLQYLLGYLGYNSYTELSSYIDFSKYQSDLLSNLSYARQKQYKKCLKAGMRFQEINEDDGITHFYELLVENLSRFNVKPVHSINELLDFKNSRLTDVVNFYGVKYNDCLVAGGMSFSFRITNTIHIQYSAARRDLGTLSPMSFLYFGLIENAKNQGINNFSWGISTEKKGEVLNLALAETKESYGSKYSVNRTYFKEFIV